MVLIFESTHKVISAEKKLRSENISMKIIPTPRSISSQCGMSIKVSEIDKNRLEEILNRLEITAEIYEKYSL